MQQTVQNKKSPYWQAIISVATHAQQQNMPAAVDALVALRALEKTFASPVAGADVPALQDTPAAEGTPFPVFGHVCDALGFSQAQAICFATCLANYDTPAQCAKAQAEGAISPAAIEFALGQAPTLPTNAHLTLSMQGQALYHHADVLAELTSCLGAFFALGSNQPPLVVGVLGMPGVGRAFFAQTLADTLGYGTLCIDASHTVPDAATLQHLCAVAALYRAVVCYTNLGAGAAHTALLCSTVQHTRLVFVTAPHLAGVAGPFALLCRTLAPLQPAERLCALQGLLQGCQLPTAALQHVAKLYQLNMQKITALACRLKAEALAGQITTAQLHAAVQAVHSLALSQRATLLATNKRLADVVLPAAQHAQLAAILACVKNRETVYQDWGFAQTIPYGRGIAALFYGASGTGKTLAASALAGELGLPLYRVDLSQLTSKYVGETQKNIAQIFDEAEQTDCILFFDEADALFSRRSDGAEAQDKQINAEVAYLLQRTEAYTGVMILATNLLHNFDDAFRRRMQYMVHFPLPDAALRTLLWQGIFPVAAPTQGIDYPLLAAQLELSGAGVRNIALAAAYHAAQTNTAITTACLVQAARMEYAKLGKAFPRYLDDMYPQERSTL